MRCVPFLALSGCHMLQSLLSTTVLPKENPPGVDFGLYGSTVGGRYGAGLASGDLDGDGHPDLAVIGQAERWGTADTLVAVWTGPWTGIHDGVVGSHTLLRGGHDHIYDRISAGDFDGDGQDDLAVLESNSDAERGQVLVMPGPLDEGTPKLQGAKGVAIWEGYADNSAPSAYLEGLGDNDGDGIHELWMQFQTRNEITCLRRPMRGGKLEEIEDRFVLGSGSGDALTMASGELDGDDQREIVLGMLSGSSVYFFEGPPKGRVGLDEAEFVLDGLAGSGFGSELTVADLDGDSLDDLVVGAPSAQEDRGEVHIFKGPLQSGAEPSLVVVGREGDQLGFDLMAGDHDGDGVAELVVFRTNSLPDGLWPLDKEGVLLRFDRTGTWDLELEPAPTLVHTAGVADVEALDLDEDGLTDFVIGAPMALTSGAVFGWKGEAP